MLLLVIVLGACGTPEPDVTPDFIPIEAAIAADPAVVPTMTPVVTWTPTAKPDLMQAYAPTTIAGTDGLVAVDPDYVPPEGFTVTDDGSMLIIEWASNKLEIDHDGQFTTDNTYCQFNGSLTILFRAGVQFDSELLTSTSCAVITVQNHSITVGRTPPTYPYQWMLAIK